MLDPLSRGLTITLALISFVIIMTFMSSLIDLHKRNTQPKDTRALEPTVSALGMKTVSMRCTRSHGEPASQLQLYVIRIELFVRAQELSRIQRT